MELMSAREAAERWGISQRRVAVLCAAGRIPQAQMVGNTWIIPVTVEKPTDGRSSRFQKMDGAGARPFLKWAGGKGQLLSEIEKYYPFAGGRFTKYAEPFVGGGAALFDILGKFHLEEVYIGDINRDLINAYTVVRDEVNQLVRLLADMQAEYVPMGEDERRAYYMKKRQQFNACKGGGNTSIDIESAALMIFLNKTCFNGLYRVNRKGAFNVPMGAYKSPLICDETNLRAASKILQGVTIVCGDYRQSADFIDRNTFVYFDPPYRPLTKTASFTAYSEEVFDDRRQIELAQFVQEMNQRGARILISNSDPQNIDPDDDFFEHIYAAQQIKRVEAVRMINSKGEARGKLRELLISNV